jgi:small subunit ribosomal protein S11
MTDNTLKKEQKTQETVSKKTEKVTTSQVKNSVSLEKDKAEEKKNSPSQKTRSGKGKKQVPRGQAHIQCTYNNTMVMLSDAHGGTLAWSSSGLLGFKGAKKSTPYAATQVVADVTEKVRKFQLKELEVLVKGVGSGREAAIRALANNGFELLSIKDITPIAHNGCRPRRPRRV